MRTYSILFLFTLLSLSVAAENGTASAEKLFAKAFAAMAAEDVDALAACYPAGEWNGVNGKQTAAASMARVKLCNSVAKAQAKFGEQALAEAAKESKVRSIFRYVKLDFTNPPTEFETIAEGRVVLKWPFTSGGRERSRTYRGFEQDGVWYLYDHSLDKKRSADGLARRQTMMTSFDQAVIKAQAAADAVAWVAALETPLEEAMAKSFQAGLPTTNTLTFSKDSLKDDRYSIGYHLFYGEHDGAKTMQAQFKIVNADGSEKVVDTKEGKPGGKAIGGMQLLKEDVADVNTSKAVATVTALDGAGKILHTETVTVAFDLKSLEPKIFP